MKTKEKPLLSAGAEVTLLCAGCAGDYYVGGPYEGPYYGGFGPYYDGYAPFYEGGFVIGGGHYENHYGGHHFYGRSFGARHFTFARRETFHGAMSRPAAPHTHHHS